MSPQQIAGRASEAGPNDDIHALGVVLYLLLTGRQPYAGQGLEELLQQILRSQPRRPSEHCADVDPRLDKICLRMMAGPIEKRYRSMTAVAGELAAWLKAFHGNREQSQAATVRRQRRFAPLADSGEESDVKSGLSTADHTVTPRHFGGGAKPQPAEAMPAAAQTAGSPRRFLPLTPISTLVVALAVSACALLAGIIITVRIRDQQQASVEITVETSPSPASEAASSAVPYVEANEFQRIETVPTGIAEPLGIAFDASSTRMAVALGSGVFIYSLADGRLEKELFKPANESVLAMASTADGTRLIAATLKHVRIWNLTTLEELHSFPIDAPETSSPSPGAQSYQSLIAISNDGRQAALVRPSPAADGDKQGKPGWAVQVRDTPTGKTTQTLPLVHQPATLAFAPDGMLLAAGTLNNNIVAWNVAKGTVLYEKTAAKSVLNLAFSANGQRLAAAVQARAPMLYDALTGDQIRELPVANASHLAFSPDRVTLATISADQGIRLWDIDSGQQRGKILQCPSPASVVAFSPDGLFIAAAHEKGIDAWMLPQNLSARSASSLVGLLFHPAANPQAMALSPNGKIVATAAPPLQGETNSEIRFWDVGRRTLVRRVSTNLSDIRRLRFSPDASRIAAMSNNGQFEFWDPNTGDRQKTDGASPNSLVAAQRDGLFDFYYIGSANQLLLAGKLGYEIFETDSLKTVRKWSEPFPGAPHVVQWIPAARVMLAGAIIDQKTQAKDGATRAPVRVWDVQKQELVHEWRTEAFEVDVIDASADGSSVLTGGLGIFELWDRRQQPPVRLHRWDRDKRGGHFGQTCGALSPDGRQLLLATTDKENTFLAQYDARTGQLLAELPSHRGATVHARFLPDSIHAVSIGYDQALRIWSLPAAVDQDRTAAEWVVKQGGKVRFVSANGSTIGYTAAIPEGAIALFGITLNDRQAIPNDELNRISLLPKLRELQLIGSTVTDDGVSRLSGLPQLSMLYLNRTRITDKAGPALARFANLTQLGLQGTKITSAAMKHLLPLRGLTSLDLSDTSVDDAVIPFLNAFPNLSELYLGGTAVTDALAGEFPQLASLRLLDLSNSRMSAEAVERLRARVPGAKVVWSSRR